MLNIEKQIEHWRKGALSNYETAELLIHNDKLIEGLFFCHLAIEKMLKALYVKHHRELAPKIHKLQYLAQESAIELSEEQKDFFGMMMQFQIEGRYPEFYPARPSQKDALHLLYQTLKTLEWLTRKL